MEIAGVQLKTWMKIFGFAAGTVFLKNQFQEVRDGLDRAALGEPEQSSTVPPQPPQRNPFPNDGVIV